MNIITKLKNPKYCEGCPCINEDNEFGQKCNLGFWDDEWGNATEVPKPEKEFDSKKLYKIVRPQKCIKENGK